jgi:hypothetical protein
MIHLSTKVAKLVVGVTPQLVKPTRVPWDILVLFIFGSKNRAFDCPKKTKAQNMFWTKPTITTTIVVYKFDNVLVNVVATIMIHSQVLEQLVVKERESVKAKTTNNWQNK